MVLSSNPGLFHHQKQNRGFTLVELVLVMLITGIMVAIMGAVLTRPMQGYVALTQRAALVDQAEMALRRMQRDIRRALPNSIRIKGNAIEMVNVVESIVYREGVTPASATELDFTSQDTSFNTVGSFGVQPPVVASTAIRLVIYNLPVGTVDGTNVYAQAAPGPFPPAGSHVITPPGMAITIGAAAANEHTITLAAPGHQFALRSPQQRLYVVDTPITYICDPAVGTLTRYSGYPIQQAQPTDPTVAPLSNAGVSSDPLSTNLSACGFVYLPGNTQRTGIVRMSLTITEPDSGESVSLMHQVHVVNAS